MIKISVTIGTENYRSIIDERIICTNTEYKYIGRNTDCSMRISASDLQKNAEVRQMPDVASCGSQTCDSV